ncbi:carbonic anhydrase [Erythrobacter sp. THAF29]|uniref:carbonic anhydrase n=1 Tax=Erythrobacter sp. THAF29 TaxID=2587851 RepID=UPI00126816D7|nr:carbonic anhydrase [Erythrobacter sp. THAF29]
MNDATDTPLDGLVAGYNRFRSGDWAKQRERWAELGEGQSPRTMVISCSDSRVDPAQIFDVDPGTIFVVRNVAALVPPFETTVGQHGVSAALEFAVQVLEVEEVLVMGHGLCGGCQAALTGAMKGKEVGKGHFVGNWVSLLDEARIPVAEKYGTDSREAEFEMELAAVRVSLENLMTFPFVRQKVEGGELRLRGAHFAISDGILRVLDTPDSDFREA